MRSSLLLAMSVVALSGCGSEGTEPVVSSVSVVRASVVALYGDTVGGGSASPILATLTLRNSGDSSVVLRGSRSAPGLRLYDDSARTRPVADHRIGELVDSLVVPPGDSLLEIQTFAHLVGESINQFADRINPEGGYWVDVFVPGHDSLAAFAGSLVLDVGGADLEVLTTVTVAPDSTGALALMADATLRNVGQRTVEVFHGVPWAFGSTLEGYLSPDRVGTPAFSLQDRFGFGFIGYRATLGPGREYRYGPLADSPNRISSLLGDSLPSGTYYLASVVALNNVRLRKPAGEVVLTLE
jgi:hypothetical protein